MKRHAAFLLSAGALALILMGMLVSATLAATATSIASDRHDLRLTGGSPIVVSGVMPGDQVATRTIELSATGALRYRMHVTYDGSQALAEALLTTLTGADGAVLYQGPLAEARVGGIGCPSAVDPALADGQTTTITISVILPLSAGAETQGGSVQFSIVVESFEDAG
jgi:hypothetical protein